MTKERVVLDNNLLISGLLLAASIPGRVFHLVLKSGEILVSEATLNELADVLSRSKFDRYISIKDRQEFLRLLSRVANIVPITYKIHACRDPKDDMLLEVAVNGEAQAIVTGDQDLLSLNPFHGIPIVTPAKYIKR
ncbi:MAG TPA: putative toxin-antitoxin system toxin component, PIN family [Bryobacteraceae bacterium]|nr:putative toxin-antitoxin system toxin component, PIN family [Bryobacteraceae bacterium]